MKQLLQTLFATLTLSLVQTVCAQAPDTTVNGLNAFAFDLYNKVNKPGQNTVFSPYSLSSLLGILTTGSAGNTHAQLLKILHLNNDINGLNSRLDQINTTLMQNQAIIIGNALWAENNFTYKPAFLNAMQQLHTMDFFRVDFTQTAPTTSKMNDWVATKTKGYITNLIGSVPAETRLILTNAIYFKGLWALPFDAQETKQQSFYSENGKAVQVAMMNKQAKFTYTENDKLQMLLMNYTNSPLAMAVILPKTGHHLQELQQALNQNSFSQLTQSADDVEVILSLPKFKIESTFDSLNSAVSALGLTNAFDASANFSNMTNEKLFISAIIQKALIQVDEKGTVAAAATGIMMGSAMMANPPKPVNFIANHPFLFVVYDVRSGLILFMGQVVNPQS